MIVVEGPEEEYEIPEGKKTYSADAENWEAQIPGDHCELYFTLFQGKIKLTLSAKILN